MLLPQFPKLPGLYNFLRRLHPHPRDTENHFQRSPVHVDGEKLWIAEGIAEFRVDFEVKVRMFIVYDFVHFEAVKAEQPIRLVQPVFPYEGWRFQGRQSLVVADGHIAGIVDPPQFLLFVQIAGEVQNVQIVLRRRPDHELGALPAGGKKGRFFEEPPLILVARNFFLQKIHGGVDALEILIRGYLFEAPFRGDFEVYAQAVGIEPGLVEQFVARPWNGLQVNVAIEFVLLPQFLGDAHQALHGIVGIFENAAAEEKPFDVIPLVEIDGQVHHFLNGEGGPFHVIRTAAHAVCAVENTVVGEQNFQERNAAAVLRVSVADAHARGIAEATFGILSFAAGAGTAHVIFGGISEYFKFFFDAVIHVLGV